ncbi:hypothetical protein C8J56DRAFT_979528 [Mycena floridula]|nr:hypothetical protein C8J56DRAFT_979528 [Mycena floridula]
MALRNLLRRFWSPKSYVGRDLEGNTFYERINPLSETRMKRFVEYRNPDDYIGGSKKIPVQWSAWLSHTRVSPPSVEELESDAARQQRVLINAARIEARDRQERLGLNAPTRLTPTEEHKSPEPPGPEQTATPSSTSPFPVLPSDAFEPQSWKPRPVVRGSDK